MSAGHQMLMGLGDMRAVRDVTGTFQVASYYTPTSDGGMGPTGISMLVQFNRSGTIGFSPNVGPILINYEEYIRTIPDYWYTPAGGTPGDSYWIRFTQISGSAFSTGVLNTWQRLDASRSIGYAPNTAARSGTVQVDIASDAGGTIIVRTSSMFLRRYQVPV